MKLGRVWVVLLLLSGTLGSGSSSGSWSSDGQASSSALIGSSQSASEGKSDSSESSPQSSSGSSKSEGGSSPMSSESSSNSKSDGVGSGSSTMGASSRGSSGSSAASQSSAAPASSPSGGSSSSAPSETPPGAMSSSSNPSHSTWVSSSPSSNQASAVIGSSQSTSDGKSEGSPQSSSKSDGGSSPMSSGSPMGSETSSKQASSRQSPDSASSSSSSSEIQGPNSAASSSGLLAKSSDGNSQNSASPQSSISSGDDAAAGSRLVHITDGSSFSNVTFEGARSEFHLTGEDFQAQGFSDWNSAGINKAVTGYRGGMIVKDDLWMMPFGGFLLTKVNKHTGIMTAYNAGPLGLGLHSSNNFYSCVYDGGNHLWMIPARASMLIRVDTTDGSLTGYPTLRFTGTFYKYTAASYDGLGGFLWLTPSDQLSGYMKVERVNTQNATYDQTSFSNWPDGFTPWVTSTLNGAALDSKGIHWMVPAKGTYVVGVNTRNSSEQMRGINIQSTEDPWPQSVKSATVKFFSVVNTVDDQTGTKEYLYLIPWFNCPIVRLDTNNGTGTPLGYDSWPAGFTPSATAASYTGAIFDGRYLWLPPAPTQNSLAVLLRFETSSSADGGVGTMKVINTWPSGFVRGYIPFAGMSFDPTSKSLWFIPYSANMVVRMQVAAYTQTATEVPAAGDVSSSSSSGGGMKESSRSSGNGGVGDFSTPSSSSGTGVTPAPAATSASSSVGGALVTTAAPGEAVSTSSAHALPSSSSGQSAGGSTTPVPATTPTPQPPKPASSAVAEFSDSTSSSGSGGEGSASIVTSAPTPVPGTPTPAAPTPATPAPGSDPGTSSWSGGAGSEASSDLSRSALSSSVTPAAPVTGSPPPTPSPPEATVPPVPRHGLLVAVNGTTLLDWIRGQVSAEAQALIPENQTLLDDSVLKLTEVETVLNEVLSQFLMLTHTLHQKNALLSMTSAQLVDVVKTGSLANTAADTASVGYNFVLKFNLTQSPSDYPPGGQLLLITIFTKSTTPADSPEVPSDSGAETLKRTINSASSRANTLSNLGILSAAKERNVFPTAASLLDASTSPTRSAKAPPQKSQWATRYGAPRDGLNTAAQSPEGVELWVFLVVLLCSVLISAVLGVVISKFAFKPKEPEAVRTRLLDCGALDVPQAIDDDATAAFLHRNVSQQYSTTFAAPPLRQIEADPENQASLEHPLL